MKIDHQKNQEGHHQKEKANQQILALEKIKSKILQSSHHNMASTIIYRESVAISRGENYQQRRRTDSEGLQVAQGLNIH